MPGIAAAPGQSSAGIRFGPPRWAISAASQEGDSQKVLLGRSGVLREAGQTSDGTQEGSATSGADLSMARQQTPRFPAFLVTASSDSSPRRATRLPIRAMLRTSASTLGGISGAVKRVYASDYAFTGACLLLPGLAGMGAHLTFAGA